MRTASVCQNARVLVRKRLLRGQREDILAAAQCHVDHSPGEHDSREADDSEGEEGGNSGFEEDKDKDVKDPMEYDAGGDNDGGRSYRSVATR